jgi:hypothetical protein
MNGLSGHARIDYIPLFSILRGLVAALDRGLFALLPCRDLYFHGVQALSKTPGA